MKDSRERYAYLCFTLPEFLSETERERERERDEEERARELTKEWERPQGEKKMERE